MTDSPVTNIKQMLNNLIDTNDQFNERLIALKKTKVNFLVKPTLTPQLYPSKLPKLNMGPIILTLQQIEPYKPDEPYPTRLRANKVEDSFNDIKLFFENL